VPHDLVHQVVDHAQAASARLEARSVTEGLFVVKLRDAEWFTFGARGAACRFPPEQQTDVGKLAGHLDHAASFAASVGRLRAARRRRRRG
jgi:hypothetical protein